MAISSINFQKASQGAFSHNARTEKVEPEYLLPKKFRLKNEVNRTQKEADAFLQDLYKKAKIDYKKLTGQKLQAKKFHWEAVVNLNDNHTLENLEKLAAAIQIKTGFTPVQISIHKDEGRVDQGTPIYNLHAHINFFTLDQKTGQQLFRRAVTAAQLKTNPEIKPMNRERLSSLQDLTAEVLEMERGKKGSKAVRQEHKQYKAEQKTIERLNKIIQSQEKDLASKNEIVIEDSKKIHKIPDVSILSVKVSDGWLRTKKHYYYNTDAVYKLYQAHEALQNKNLQQEDENLWNLYQKSSALVYQNSDEGLRNDLILDYQNLKDENKLLKAKVQELKESLKLHEEVKYDTSPEIFEDIKEDSEPTFPSM